MVVLMFCFYRTRRKRCDPQTSSCLEVKMSKTSNASLGKECALKADSQSSPISSSNLETNLPSNQIIKKIRAIDWYQFEQVVGVVYRKLGYSVTRKGGANPDGGIDLIIEKNEEKIAVQCKQWKTWNVGVKAVREFLGALSDSGLKKGVFVTLCGYSGDAKRLAEKHGIQLLNETDLAQMLEKVDARYDPEIIAALNDTQKLCPKCESKLVLRTVKKGANAGDQFWGCSKYPACRFTMPYR